MSGGVTKAGRVSALLATLVLLACACGADGGEVGDDEGSVEQSSVTLALNWLPVAEAAGWYSALEEGYFEEAGLDVSIVRGFGSGDTVTRVAAGEVEFGIADVAALIPARANEEVPVRAVGAFYGQAPHTIFYRGDSDITQPADLESKSIACTVGNAVLLMFPAFASANDVEEDGVEWKMSDPGAVIPAFTSGQTDALCELRASLPIVEDQMGDAGVEYFGYSDYGVEGYAHQILTSERMIEEAPSTVRAFVSAAVRGMEYAIDNPDQAVDYLLKHAPENDREVASAAWEIVAGLLQSPDGAPVGSIDDERMTRTIDVLTTSLELEQTPPEEIYTTEFLPDS